MDKAMELMIGLVVLTFDEDEDLSVVEAFDEVIMTPAAAALFVEPTVAVETVDIALRLVAVRLVIENSDEILEMTSA